MADRRRRRRASVNSEEFSEDETSETPSEKNGVKKPTQNIEQEETESESGEEEESEEEDSEEEEDEDEEDVTADYDGDDDIIVDDDGGWIEEERQSGDGEEQPDSTKEKDLDDDEDRKNPAYIPRRGMFYEHDDRRMDEPQEGGVPPTDVPPEKEQQESRPKKKLWKEEMKWDHDRFISEQQAPKSREELIAEYGYDIRLYDKPPDRPRPRNRDRQPRRKKQFSDYIPEDRFRKDRYQDNGDHYRNQSQYSNNSYQNDNNRPQGDNRDRGYRGDRERGYRDNQERGYRGRSDRQRGGFRGRGNSWRKNAPRSYEELREGNNDRYRENDNEENQNQYSSRQWTNNSFRINDHSSHEDSSSPEKIRSPDRYEQSHRSSNRNNSKQAHAAPPSRNNADSVPASRQPPPQQEKKSYLRERRSKGIGKTRYQASDVQDVQDNLEQLDIKDDPPKTIKTEMKENAAVTSYVYPTTAPPITTIPMPPPGSLEKKEVQNANVKSSLPPPVTGNNAPSNKVDKKAYPVTSNNAQSSSTKPEVVQSRTKRYSSQRQRGMQDAPYQEQILEGAPPAAQPYYGQAFPGNTGVFRPEQPIPQPVSHGFNQQPRIPSPVRYTMPVTSHGAMHSPPRLYTSPLTTLATAQQIPSPALLQPPFLTPPGIRFAPPAGAPPSHYPMGGHISVQGFPPAPPPQPQPQIAVPSQQQPEIHIRGGTTYFPTEVQQPSRQRGGTTYFPPEVQQHSPHRSPVRRQKAAIPIVNPQDVHSEAGEKGEVLTEYYYPEEDAASVDPPPTDPACPQQVTEASELLDAVSSDYHAQPVGHSVSEMSDPQTPDHDQTEATPVSHSNGVTETKEMDAAYTQPESGSLEDKTDLPCSSSDGIQNEQNTKVEVAPESNMQEVEIIPITDTKMLIKDSQPVSHEAEPASEPTSQSLAATETEPVPETECNIGSDSPTTAPVETVQTLEMEKTEPPAT